VATEKKDVFSMGPLKRDFLRRAKTRDVGGGLERGGGVEVLRVVRVGEVVLESLGAGGLDEKLVCGEERTTRMLEGKCVVVVGVAGRTLTEVLGERLVKVAVLMEPEP
jgi:hypothetical protein